MTHESDSSNLVELGSVLSLVRNGLSIKQSKADGGLPITRIETISNGSIDPERVGFAGVNPGEKDQWLMAENDILFSHINSEEHLGKCAIYDGRPRHLIHGMNLLNLRADDARIRPRYLLHALRSNVIRRQIPRVANRSVNQASVSIASLKSLRIPLPPLSEQKRIADILDKADAIHRKRQESLRLCGEFRRSLFLKLFGDPSLNRKSFPRTTLADVCGGDLRNGVSPSKKGGVSGKVLILSAITGPAFNSAAVKEGMFDNPFKADQLVNEGNFLICRGNGNRTLCGSGRFATRSFADTVFPDTIIAARLDGTRVRPGYFEEVWSTRHVRGQIEQSARTTNGIYKVNQKTLSRISFPLPPIQLQKQFDQTVRKASTIQHRLQDASVDDLFNSLVQRAFKGEL